MQSGKIGYNVATNWRASSIHRTIRKRTRIRKVKESIERLKTEMGEIRKVQNCIRNRQLETKGNIQEIESECSKLRNESKFIHEMSKDTQLRLNLMFKILRAREDNDLAKANDFTRSLRELIAKQNKV
ncbi:hypothetical protein CFOL_v3_12741 [Cephalotus follicularis]|uniref:Uncharacterized protein n=1 Tax=Cephalotus follicularis TaxID=3775 RepID=A0A1Q3BMI9_CEPFO|nr:hypothetical protein CFOL_v3_12741 [Cephalotus follicularis]